MLPIYHTYAINIAFDFPHFIFAEQRLNYQLIRMLNAYGSMTFTLKAQSLFFYGFKTFVKVQLINDYADGCHDTSCITCHIIAHRHNIGVRI